MSLVPSEVNREVGRLLRYDVKAMVGLGIPLEEALAIEAEWRGITIADEAPVPAPVFEPWQPATVRKRRPRKKDPIVPRRKSDALRGLVEPIDSEPTDGAIDVHLPRHVVDAMFFKRRQEARGLSDADLVTLWRRPERVRDRTTRREAA